MTLGPFQIITDLRRKAERMADSIKNSKIMILLSEWKKDPHNMKKAFLELRLIHTQVIYFTNEPTYTYLVGDFLSI